MILSLMVSLLVVLKWNDTSKMVLPILRTIEGGGASGAGGALPPSVTGRGKALPSLLVTEGGNALRHGQGEGVAFPAGAVTHLRRGGGGAGDCCAGVVGHKVLFVLRVAAVAIGDAPRTAQPLLHA